MLAAGLKAKFGASGQICGMRAAFGSPRFGRHLSSSSKVVQGYERDNRSKNKALGRKLDPGKPISRKLSKCRTTKEFVDYARGKGAKVKINSNHVKVSTGNVVTGFSSVGRKNVLNSGVRKQKIEAFMAMGIAWDD